MLERCRESLCQLRALARNEMVIADIELAQGVGHRGGDARVAVPEAEDTAVAMAVDETKSGVRIFEPDALTFPHDHLKAHLLVVRELVGRDVLSKNIEQIFYLAKRPWD